MDVFGYQDYREILRSELARRMRQNPRYSQGAFARDLALTPGRLSEILHGKQGVSTKVATQISRGLRFSDEESAYFLDLVESQHGRSRLLREAARLRLHRYRRVPFAERMGEDAFRVISDWYHVAILELLRLPSERKNPEWIAETLSIELDEARMAVERLVRLGLIAQDQEGVLHLVEANQRFSGSMHAESFQKYARQILWRALEAVDKTQLKAMHSYILALPESQMPQLLRILKESADRLAETLDLEQGEKSKDVVYCLALQLFPLSRVPPQPGSDEDSEPSDEAQKPSAADEEPQLH